MRELTRILAIELTSKGFAFAVLEGPDRLSDWGGRQVDGDVSIFLVRLGHLFDRYQPNLLVLEEPAGSRRGHRGREWLAWAEELASERELGFEARPITICPDRRRTREMSSSATLIRDSHPSATMA